MRLTICHPSDSFFFVLLLLAVENHQLPEAGEHDEQADTSETEFSGNGPKEDEQADADEYVVDAFAADIRCCGFFEEVFRQLLSAGQGLFRQAVLGFPVFIAEEEYYEYDE